MSMNKKLPVKILTFVSLLILIASVMIVTPSAEEYDHYTNESFTESWALYMYGALNPQVVFKVMLSPSTYSNYDYYFLCINEQEPDNGLLYVVEDCNSTNLKDRPYKYTWSYYYDDITTGGVHKPVKTKCAVIVYGINVTNETCDKIYDGISNGVTYGYSQSINATGVLLPYKVGNVAYVFDGTEPAIVTLSTIFSCLTNEGQVTLAEINYMITHKADPSEKVYGYDWYCPADVDAIINAKDNANDKVLGEYQWYSYAEYHNMRTLLDTYKSQLSEEQIKSMTAYEQGLADGRSDVSSLGDGITSLGTNIGTAFKTILNDISLGGITLGDLLLFFCFGVIVFVIIIVAIRLLKG